MAINKPLLRSVLKNLHAVPYDRRDYSNRMMAPQEMLDFLGHGDRYQARLPAWAGV